MKAGVGPPRDTTASGYCGVMAGVLFPSYDITGNLYLEKLYMRTQISLAWSTWYGLFDSETFPTFLEFPTF